VSAVHRRSAHQTASHRPRLSVGMFMEPFLSLVSPQKSPAPSRPSVRRSASSCRILSWKRSETLSEWTSEQRVPSSKAIRAEFSPCCLSCVCLSPGPSATTTALASVNTSRSTSIADPTSVERSVVGIARKMRLSPAKAEADLLGCVVLCSRTRTTCWRSLASSTRRRWSVTTVSREIAGEGSSACSAG
jgi:hypothetical protein